MVTGCPEKQIAVRLSKDAPPLAEDLVRRAGREHLRRHEIEPLRWLCSHPSAPEDLLLLLCHLPECRAELGHRKGPRRVLEVLADVYQYDEAILTIGKQLYTDPVESPHKFADFIESYINHEWLLRMLAYEVASCRAKQESYLTVVDQSVFAQEIRALIELQTLCQQAAHESQSENIETLYQQGRPEVWRALAANPNTPVTLLENMTRVTDIKHAAEIRRRAAETLQNTVSR